MEGKLMMESCSECGRLKIFVPVMILGFAILVPINVGGGALVNSDWVDSSIDRLSMSNVSKRSMRCVYTILLWSTCLHYLDSVCYHPG
jgi:hypothetical protein